MIVLEISAASFWEIQKVLEQINRMDLVKKLNKAREQTTSDEENGVEEDLEVFIDEKGFYSFR